MFDVERDGCETNRLAHPPTYTLQLEDLVRRIAEGLVLVQELMSDDLKRMGK